MTTPLGKVEFSATEEQRMREDRRRKLYDRADKMRKIMGMEADPISRAQTNERINESLDQ